MRVARKSIEMMVRASVDRGVATNVPLERIQTLLTRGVLRK